MKYTNYYNNIRLRIKGLTKMKVYPVIVVLIGSIYSLLSVRNQFALSRDIQLFFVFSLTLCIIYMLQVKYSMIQIPAFEYSLKLMTEFGLRVYIYCKVSFFSLTLIYILFSIFSFDKMMIVILFLYQVISILVTISRRTTPKEAVIVFLYSSLVFLGINYLMLWLFYGVVYLFTNVLPLDSKQMYTHSLLYDEALSHQNETAYKLQSAEPRMWISPEYVDKIFRFYILKMISLTKFLMLLIFGSLMGLTLINITGFHDLLKVMNALILIICYTVLLEKITLDDDKLLKAKILSQELMRRIRVSNYTVFVGFSGLAFLCISQLSMFFQLSIFNISHVLIALISVMYLIVKHAILSNGKWVRKLADVLFYTLVFLMF